MSWRLYDMHCHLDSFEKPEAVADALADRNIAVFAATVTPRRYEQAQALAKKPNVRLALGMHPWYFEKMNVSSAIEKVLELANTTRFVGEVGLDFYERHAPQSTWVAQKRALERILEACACTSDAAHPTVISLHAVRAADAVLDLIERTGCTKRCACIFHWFGGSTDELWRAIKLGCWFSCNENMMGIKRSKEYAKLIPADRLLLETDYPPSKIHKEAGAWAADIERSLSTTITALAEARSTSAASILELTSSNAQLLFD